MQYKKTIIIAGTVFVAFIAISGLIAWMYTGNVSPIKAKIMRTVPLPAALIELKPVRASELLAHLDLAERIVGENKLTKEQRQMAYDQFLSGKKVEMLAQTKGVAATPEQINNEYHSMVSHYTSDDSEAFAKQLQDNYQMTPEQFRTSILKQDISLNNLALWYHSQESLNRDAYEKARKIFDKAESGTKFEDVAREYGGETADKAFAGDEGFVNIEDLLPEFQEALAKASQDQILLAPSRYGLHVIKLLGKSENPEGGIQLHLQQIYVEGSGFEKWYQEAVDNMKTIKILRLF